MAEQFDLVILGSGSTAFAAALRASALGARVAMTEQGTLGGTCINWGCVPSKTLIHSAQLYQEARLGARAGLGLSITGLDLGPLFKQKNDVVGHLRRTRYIDLLAQVQGLSLVKGRACFIDNRTVAVGDHILKSDRFLIATGGRPKLLAIPGLDQVDYLTSYSALQLKEFPASLIIIGGGVVALELGQMLSRFGRRVTILEHGMRLLPTVEQEPALAVQQALIGEGMEIVCSVSVCAIARQGGETMVSAMVGGKLVEFAAERLLLATGTEPASDGIGLEEAGVAVDDKGFVKVDERMRTTSPGIWAAGDVIGGMMIATVGAREGVVAVDDMLNPDCGCKMDYFSAPMAIFTDPEVGLVGHTVASAERAGLTVRSNLLPVSLIPRAHINGRTAGVIKMVAEAGSGRLLGVQLACQGGAEIINEAALAVQLKATVTELANTLHVYPSMSEGLRLCAQGFSRDVTRLSCCAE